jgi:hypothetical protein
MITCRCCATAWRLSTDHWVSADALRKKRIRTELPTERLDTEVLEVLVELDDAADLRPGLRVDLFIER